MKYRESVLINIKNIISRLFWIRKEFDETTGYIKVIWDDRDANEVGFFIFGKAKKSWQIKPIINNKLNIVDANTFNIINILHQHVDFDEREYLKIREILIEESKKVL